MQAVILAAGRGARMGAATDSLPKPMLEVLGKTLIEYKFDALPNEVSEVVLVIGWMGEKIQEKFGNSFQGRSVRYVTQEVLDGTMGALARAKEILHDKFLVMMGDDVYSKEDAQKCMRNTDGWSLVVQQTDSTRAGGAVEIDPQGNILSITEGAHAGLRYVSTNLFLLDPRIFEFPMVPKAEGSGEFGLPQTALSAAK
ncbi:MAG: hypothetical protein RIQ56_723, partial [Candidatus Parcubacteria bacterium]